MKKTFYIIDVLMQRFSLSHPEEKFIYWFPQNMEGAWPATPFSKNEKKHRFYFLDSFLVSMPNFVKFGDVRLNPY